MNGRALADLLTYLGTLPLDPDLRQSLEEEASAFLEWGAHAGREIAQRSAVLKGLRYLRPGPAAPVPAEPEVLRDLALVGGAPRFHALLMLVAYLLLEARRFDLSLLRYLEPLEDRLAGVAPAANRLAALAGAATMPARARARGLPPDLVEAARLRTRELAFACPSGIPFADLPDLAYDLRLVSYDHGGFSFSLQAFTGPVRVLSPEGSPHPVVLPENGRELDAEGYLWNPACGSPPAWVARVHCAGEALEANTIVGPDGLCHPASIRLGPPLPRTLLARGDDALEMHVEAGASLDDQSLTQALAAATEHYRRHFPDFSPRAAFMVSWLLDPQLPALLGERSRIRHFRRHFRLYPCRYDPDYARACVLGGLSPARAPTSLQKALLEREAQGGCLREGGGLILLS